MSTFNTEGLQRQWGALRLTTGFYLVDMVRSVLQFADTDERKQAIEKVITLLDSGCTEEQQWYLAAEALGDLLSAHPDRYKESGTWYDGEPSILALATAYEAAMASKFRLYPSLHSEGQIDGRIYKVFKYVLRAMMQKPETAVTALQWVERHVDLMPLR